MGVFAKLFGDFLVFVYRCFDRIVIHGYLTALSRPEATSVSSGRRGAPWGQVTAVALLGAISRGYLRREPNDRVLLP